MPRASPLPPDAGTLERVQEDWSLYRQLGAVREGPDGLVEHWASSFDWHRRRLAPDGSRIDPAAVRRFWGRRLFISDDPTLDLRARWRDLVDGERRLTRRLLRECLEVLEGRGYAPLLRRYPCPTVGGPVAFQQAGYRYTHRWFRHVYLLGLFNEVLGGRVAPGFVSLDIGCGYGLFQSLLHREHPRSRHVLVDLPEQLVLARYFLECSHPSARIAGPRELAGEKPISRQLLEDHDFVLLAPAFYERLAPGSVDLVTSFSSLGELRRSFFDYYVDAPVFRRARHLFTVNPVAPTPSFFPDAEVDLLDYPILGGKERLHFAVSPAFRYEYNPVKRRRWLSWELRGLPPYFEYVGGIRAGRGS